MTTIEMTTNSDGEGRVHLDIPTGMPHAQILLHVTMEVAEEKRARTKNDYLAFIDSVFGKGTDPTFIPPPDQEVLDVDAL